jgi:hypothetical protein
MSEHDIALKCARQVADLQALLIDVTQQRADLQAENARLLTGLLALRPALLALLALLAGHRLAEPTDETAKRDL